MNVRKNVGWKVDDAKAAKYKQGTRHAQGHASGGHGLGSGIQNAFCSAKNSNGTDKLLSGDKILDGFPDILMGRRVTLPFALYPASSCRAGAICPTHHDFADLV